ncbi:MAG TPA: hypothetical protein VKJ01_12835, partial [Candidatus Solibacter sp.]|nr:hypothetical protein [Candidatus Solibacter sp.]
MRPLALFAIALGSLQAAVPLDIAGVRPGPVTVTSTPDSVTARWTDEANSAWTAEFSLDPKAALITAIKVNGAVVIDHARPFYQCTT